MANGLKTAVLLAALSGMLLAAGEYFGGQQGLIMALVFAALMNLGSYWFSDKIVLRMYRAQEVGPSHPLYQMTERLARQAGLPMPKVYIIPDSSPNAFATGRNPQHAAVAATEGILQVPRRRSSRGHRARARAREASRHSDQFDRRYARRAIMMLARMAMFFGGARDDRDEGGNPIAMLAMMILAPLAAVLTRPRFPARASSPGYAGAARITGNPHARRMRFARSTRSRAGFHSTPIRQRRTCSSSSRFPQRLLSLFSTHPATEARASPASRQPISKPLQPMGRPGSPAARAPCAHPWAIRFTCRFSVIFPAPSRSTAEARVFGVPLAQSHLKVRHQRPTDRDGGGGSGGFRHPAKQAG